MDKALLENLGWQAAGYLISLALPFLLFETLRLLRSKAAGTQWQAVERVVERAVGGAEQYLSTTAGVQKKAWVLLVVQGWLDAHHVKLDAAAIDALIESAVRDQKMWGSYAADPAPAPVDPARLAALADTDKRAG
jgi:hypothetical protein